MNSETFDVSSLLLKNGLSNDFAAKIMEVELYLHRIGKEMIEVLGGLKPQSADQQDWNFFQDDNDTHKKSKERREQSQQKQEQGQITEQQKSKPETF